MHVSAVEVSRERSDGGESWAGLGSRSAAGERALAGLFLALAYSVHFIGQSLLLAEQ